MSSKSFLAVPILFVCLAVEGNAQIVGDGGSDISVSSDSSSFIYNGSNGCSLGYCDLVASRTFDPSAWSPGLSQNFVDNWQASQLTWHSAASGPGLTDQLGSLANNLQQSLSSAILNAAQNERDLLNGVVNDPVGSLTTLGSATFALEEAVRGNPQEAALEFGYNEVAGASVSLGTSLLNGAVPAAAFADVLGGTVVDLSAWGDSQAGPIAYNALGLAKAGQDVMEKGAQGSQTETFETPVTEAPAGLAADFVSSSSGQQSINTPTDAGDENSGSGFSISTQVFGNPNVESAPESVGSFSISTQILPYPQPTGDISAASSFMNADSSGSPAGGNPSGGGFWNAFTNILGTASQAYQNYLQYKGSQGGSSPVAQQLSRGLLQLQPNQQQNSAAKAGNQGATSKQTSGQGAQKTPPQKTSQPNPNQQPPSQTQPGLCPNPAFAAALKACAEADAQYAADPTTANFQKEMTCNKNPDGSYIPAFIPCPTK